MHIQRKSNLKRMRHLAVVVGVVLLVSTALSVNPGFRTAISLQGLDYGGQFETPVRVSYRILHLGEGHFFWDSKCVCKQMLCKSRPCSGGLRACPPQEIFEKK